MSNDRLFTVIVEFKGGTYIGQIYADVPISAARHWLAIRRDEDLITWGICRDELQAQLKSDRLVTLDGLASV